MASDDRGMANRWAPRADTRLARRWRRVRPLDHRAEAWWLYRQSLGPILILMGVFVPRVSTDQPWMRVVALVGLVSIGVAVLAAERSEAFYVSAAGVRVGGVMADTISWELIDRFDMRAVMMPASVVNAGATCGVALPERERYWLEAVMQDGRRRLLVTAVRHEIGCPDQVLSDQMNGLLNRIAPRRPRRDDMEQEQNPVSLGATGSDLIVV